MVLHSASRKYEAHLRVTALWVILLTAVCGAAHKISLDAFRFLCFTLLYECESIQTTVRTRRSLWTGALLRMGDNRLPKRVMSGELENAGKRGPGGKEKEWTDCLANDRRLFGITGDWNTAALDPGVWYSAVHEGGRRFMAAWVKEEENASSHRQKKREAEEADKVEVAPGVTVPSLRRFRAALIGPTQGLTKRRRLCR